VSDSNKINLVKCEEGQLLKLNNSQFRTMDHPLSNIKKESQFTKCLNRKLLDLELSPEPSKHENSGAENQDEMDSECFKTKDSRNCQNLRKEPSQLPIAKSPHFKFTISKKFSSQNPFKGRQERTIKNNLIQSSQTPGNLMVKTLGQSVNCVSNNSVDRPQQQNQPFGKKNIYIDDRCQPLSIEKFCKSGNEIAEKRLILGNPKNGRKVNISIELGSFQRKPKILDQEAKYQTPHSKKILGHQVNFSDLKK
jgi:hypothetical protein